jgi:hypothetical protein
LGRAKETERLRHNLHTDLFSSFNDFRIVVLNFVIAAALFFTPMIVHSLVGSGLSSMGQTLGTAAVAMMASAPAKGATSFAFTKAVLTHPKALTNHLLEKAKSKLNYPLPPPPQSSTNSNSVDRHAELNQRLLRKK